MLKCSAIPLTMRAGKAFTLEDAASARNYDRSPATVLPHVTGSATPQARVAETYYEHTLPEDALRGMKLLEAEVKTKS
jgi:hypothetical protein